MESNIEIIQLTDPDSFLRAKSYLEDNNIIDKNENISQFIQSLNLNKKIFIHDYTVIPFNIIDKYLFYTPISKEEDELFINFMKTTNYDLSVLQNIKFSDVINNALDKYPYHLIIDDKYFVLPDKK